MGGVTSSSNGGVRGGGGGGGGGVDDGWRSVWHPPKSSYPRLGHGGRRGFWLGWPWWPYKQLFYDTRPDLLSSKTRPPQWRMLNSEAAYMQAFFCYLGPPSHVLWNIKWPWLVTVLVSLWVVLRQDLADGWDRHSILKDTFRSTSFAMSLLLAFRLNRTYERWRQARSSLASVGVHAASAFMQAATWIRDPDILEDLRRFLIVWPYAIKQTVLSEAELDPAAAALLSRAELALYYGVEQAARAGARELNPGNGRQVVVTAVRKLVSEAELPMEHFTAIEGTIAAAWKAGGDAIRIKFQAMPQSLTLMCTGFIEIWLLLMPFGLTADSGHYDWVIVVATASTALMTLGCVEISNQMEQPFPLLPCRDIVATYEREINRVQWELQCLRVLHAEQRAERARNGTARASSPPPPPPGPPPPGPPAPGLSTP
uniref:Uncharacterized protein n=1 Tax=Chlamydomonas euryale TaxID=1486919 RepID=A0A7R9Z3M3_9CHLO|mmetsp:Transcript_41410/g.123714  ORF Transcript_41410/g.123714 Transcript_41410/m.123714 type:complete len:427 (+) Transcript_41410:606-1886(+)